MLYLWPSGLRDRDTRTLVMFHLFRGTRNAERRPPYVGTSYDNGIRFMHPQNYIDTCR